MLRIATLPFLFCLVQLAAAEVVVVDSGGAKPGSYVMMFNVGADGKLTVTRVDVVISLGDYEPDPTDPTDPTDPDPTTLEGKVQKWAEAVEDPLSADKLAIGYKTMSQQINAGTFKTKAQAVAAQKAINEQMVKDAAGDWDPFFAKLYAELDRMEGEGQLNELDDLGVAWVDIADGLNAAAPANALSPEDRAALIQLIIKIILLIISGVG